MKRFNWPTIRLLLMLALVIFLYSFTGKRNLNRKVTKAEVVFVGENQLFVKQQAVNKLLIENRQDPKTIAIGANYLRIIAISQWFSTLEISNQGAFNGLGKTIYPSAVGIVFNLARIPMVYFLSLTMNLGLDGVWWAITISSIFKGLVLFGFFYVIVIRKYKKQGSF